MKESKSKCRRKRREGDLHDERLDREHPFDHKERRLAVEEKHRNKPHPLDPLAGSRNYRYPSEERRYRQSSLDDRKRSYNSEEKRSHRQNGSSRHHSEEEHKRESSKEPRHNEHHHKQKHKRHHEDEDGLSRKKKSCRRKRDRLLESKDSLKGQDVAGGKAKSDRSRSQSAPSPSSSSSMSSPSPSHNNNTLDKPSTASATTAPAKTNESSSVLKDKRPVVTAQSSASKSSWSDEEELPARYRNNWGKKKDSDDEEGKEAAKESKPVNVKQEDEEKKPPGENKAKPDFGLSGKLVEETNMYKGVLIKYSQPPEARMPKRRWRLYPFKGDQALPTLYIHRQSAYLIGRERKIVDIPVDHPSISKQHAALQYRLVPYAKDDGSKGQRIRPYIIDLNSANGTYVNNQRIDPSKYVELLERDVLKFAFSSREYVLLHEHSSDGAQDDEAI